MNAKIRNFDKDDYLPLKTMEGKKFHAPLMNIEYNIETLDNDDSRNDGEFNAIMKFKNTDSFLYVMNIDFEFIN